MNIFITLDYELFFGKNSGTQQKCMIEPTNQLLKILDPFNIKASFFIDSGYILKLNEYRQRYPILENDYQDITSQIKSLSKNGHDIQLHIHPHWEDSYFDGKQWIIDTTRYRLHDFNDNEIDSIVYKYKKVLTDLVGDKIFTFRAGGWCLQPFDRLKSSLKKYNIWLDSTVFENGNNKSPTHFFNFSNPPKRTLWKFNNNPLIEDKAGFFTEVPISSYSISPLFFWKLAYYKKFSKPKYKAFGDGSAASSGSKLNKLKMLTQYTYGVVSIDGIRASYLNKAYYAFLKKEEHQNFVIIGHPKAISEYSLEKLEELIIQHKDVNFTTYIKEFNNAK